jgi:hypothetical protein
MSTKEEYKYKRLEHLALRKDLTEEQIAQIISALEHQEELVFVITLNTSFPSDVIEKLTEHENHQIRNQSLTFRNLSTNFLSKRVDRCLKSLDAITSLDLMAIAYNANIDGEIARKLFSSNQKTVWFGLCDNSNTPGDILEIFSKETQYHLRLARNPSTPSPVLRKLYSKDAPKDILALPNAPKDILEAGFEELKIRINKKQTGKALDILMNLAANPSCSEEMLRYMVELKFEATNYLRLLASNPSVTQEMLDLLNWENMGWFPESFYRELVGNPKTSSSLRKRIIYSKDAKGAILTAPDVTLEEIALVDMNNVAPENMNMFLDNSNNINESILKTVILEAHLPYQTKYKACQHPLANFEDVMAYALKRKQISSIHWWLLDKDEDIYNKFKAYLQKEYKVDITGMTDDMVINIMDWN